MPAPQIGRLVRRPRLAPDFSTTKVYALLSISSRIVSAAATALLAAASIPTDFGIYNKALVAQTYISLAHLGTLDYYRLYVIRHGIPANWKVPVIFAILSTSFVAVVLMPTLLNSPVLSIYAVFLVTASSVRAAAVFSVGTTKHLALIPASELLVWLPVLVVTSAYLLSGISLPVHHALLILALGSVASVIPLYAFRRLHRRSRYPSPTLLTYIQRGMPILGTMLMSGLAATLDRTVLSITLPAQQYGLYSLASITTPYLVATVGIVMNRVYVSHANAADHTRTIILQKLILISLIASACLTALTGPLLSLLGHQAARPSPSILLSLHVLQVAGSIILMAGFVAAQRGHTSRHNAVCAILLTTSLIAAYATTRNLESTLLGLALLSFAATAALCRLAGLTNHFTRVLLGYLGLIALLSAYAAFNGVITWR